VAAAGLVVSDEVALLWRHLLERDGVDRFARTVMVQLLRWESPYGWTRREDGVVADRETTLAQVLAGLLTVPDAWERAAEHYLAALDAIPHPGKGARERARVLADWHDVLLDRLAGGTAEALLDPGRRTPGTRRSGAGRVRDQGGSFPWKRPSWTPPGRGIGRSAMSAAGGPDWGSAQVRRLVEQATLDRCNDSETVTGFLTLLEEHLQLPFTTNVLSAPVRVTRIDLNDDDQIIAICTAGRSRQAVAIMDLPLPDPPPVGAEWIAAYRHWVTGQ